MPGVWSLWTGKPKASEWGEQDRVSHVYRLESLQTPFEGGLQFETVWSVLASDNIQLQVQSVWPRQRSAIQCRGAKRIEELDISASKKRGTLATRRAVLPSPCRTRLVLPTRQPDNIQSFKDLAGRNELKLLRTHRRNVIPLGNVPLGVLLPTGLKAKARPPSTRRGLMH